MANQKRYYCIYGKKKLGETEPPSEEKIAKIRNQYTNDTVFYTPPYEKLDEVSIELATE